MLRSIVMIAIMEGEDINPLGARLECINVFALGDSTTPREPANSGYYATRATLAKSINAPMLENAQKALLSRTNNIQAGVASWLAKERVPGAVGKIAQSELSVTISQSLTKFVDQIALRFSPVVTEKLAAQTAPFAGAGAGALFNYVFINHYQNMARGHFIVRRLERKYGPDIVMQAYEKAKRK
jgi:hypothetical protein